jgi:hypothetical protein
MSASARPRSSRTGRRVVTGGLATSLLAGALASGLFAPAHADETPAPVVVDDTVSLYPGQVATIDVLENDFSPSGQDLALCRFPDPDLTGENLPSVLAMQDKQTGPGAVTVLALPVRAKDTTIDYFVCDHTHLTPAVLTVDIKDVAPVVVSKTGTPGRLKVTNTNAASVVWKYGSSTARHADGKLTIPAGGTRFVRVQRRAIVWIAMIGHGGVADHGRVTNIALPHARG